MASYVIDIGGRTCEADGANEQAAAKVALGNLLAAGLKVYTSEPVYVAPAPSSDIRGEATLTTTTEDVLGTDTTEDLVKLATS